MRVLHDGQRTLAGGTAAEAIDRLTLARELWTALAEDDARRFFSAILSRCYAACATVYDRASLTILLLDEFGAIFTPPA